MELGRRCKAFLLNYLLVVRRPVAMSWQLLQEETAHFFRALGCDARVEVRVQGVRAEHKIDVGSFHEVRPRNEVGDRMQRLELR